MDVTDEFIVAGGFRIIVQEDDKEIGHAYLYLLDNDLHGKPFGLLEDVFVDEKYRGKAVGTRLVKEVLKLAKLHGCYKLIATSRYSRPAVHRWYKKLGFKKRGYEFRKDFK